MDVTPETARIIFILDEVHLNKPVIAGNSNNASRILHTIQDAVVVLEHFASNEVVTNGTAPCPDADPSDFHQQVFEQVPQARIIGGDCCDCVSEIFNLKTELCDIPTIELADIRPQLSPDERAARAAQIAEDYLHASINHQCHWTRSRMLVETCLSNNARVGIINSGTKHGDHIWSNIGYEGAQLLAAHRDISLIRIRCHAHPRSPTTQRREAAYFHWIDRGRPLWEEMIDWEWAVAAIPDGEL